jgi:hypothetical protein
MIREIARLVQTPRFSFVLQNRMRMKPKVLEMEMY